MGSNYNRKVLDEDIEIDEYVVTGTEFSDVFEERKCQYTKNIDDSMSMNNLSESCDTFSDISNLSGIVEELKIEMRSDSKNRLR